MALERFHKLPAADTLMEKARFFIFYCATNCPFFFFNVLGLFFTVMKKNKRPDEAYYLA